MTTTTPSIAALTAPALHPIEQHYKIRYIQDRLSMCYESVRQLVMNEPGVVVLSPKKPQSKRRTRNTYLVPESVLLRVMRRFTNPAVPFTQLQVA